MSAQSQSPRFRALFESAVLDYEKQTGINLVTHPLAEQLRNCHSSEDKDIATLLQEHAQALDSFQGSDRIKTIALCILSTTITLGNSIGLVRLKASMTVFCSSYTLLQLFLPAEAMHTSILVLLAVRSII
jgi:hypothetical protein